MKTFSFPALFAISVIACIWTVSNSWWVELKNSTKIFLLFSATWLSFSANYILSKISYFHWTVQSVFEICESECSSKGWEIRLNRIRTFAHYKLWYIKFWKYQNGISCFHPDLRLVYIAIKMTNLPLSSLFFLVFFIFVFIFKKY